MKFLLLFVIMGCSTAPLRPHAYGKCQDSDVLHKHEMDKHGNRADASKATVLRKESK